MKILDEFPLVSIITPSYNQVEFIEETILSVVRQNYPRLEYIIVDGGSTDGSLDVIKHYARKYPDIIDWITEKDEGQADAINKGFCRANGKIVAWLNSDDMYLFCDSITEAVNVFRQKPDIDVLYGDCIIVDQDTVMLKIQHTPSFSFSKLTRGCYISQPSVFFRRNVIENHQLSIELHLALDYEFWLRLAKTGYKFFHMSKLFAVDRNHLARKILDRRQELLQERQEVSKSYGTDRTSFLYRLQRVGDRLTYGVFARFKGVFSGIWIMNLPSATFAAPVKKTKYSTLIWQQLFKKNKDLL